MTANEAIQKISELLNFKFKRASFATTTLVDGNTEITNNLEDDFKIGQELYIVGEATLSPAPEGTHETREGLMITVDSSSVIIAIEAKAEESDSVTTETEVSTETEEEMTSATLTDGTKIETDSEGDFQVGDMLYVITEAGDKVPAPEGEHTTDSGIVITVDAEGKITGVKYPDESGEGSLQDYSQVIEVFTLLLNEVKDLSTQINKMNADYSALKTDFDSFRKQPERFSVAEKKTFKESADDWKLQIIKSSFKK